MSTPEESALPRWAKTLLPWAGVALIVWGLGHAVRGGGSASLEGVPAPALQVQLTTGETFSLAEQQGVTIVNFWASWCPPCRAEAPALQRAHESLGASGRVIGLAMDRRSVPSAERLGMRYPIAVATPELQQSFQVEMLPSTFVVNSDGTIVESFVGEVTESELRDAIQRAGG